MEFKDRVAIVTGAGNGLGRAYALELARRGAKVLVNDLGGSLGGDGQGSRVADLVVNEITKAGGIAIANYDSVTNGATIVKTAVDAWGRIDILINNAGILRDASFAKMTEQDWNLVYQVHVQGAYAMTKAAWPNFRKQKFGRIIMVASAAGLYGNFGQANYSTAKMAIIGFANTLALEGESSNIRVNTIAPIAASRMTETIMPPEMLQALNPEYITPVVLRLCHPSSQETGGVFELGAGWVSKLRWQRSKGAVFPLSSFTPEAVQQRFEEIARFGSDSAYPTSPRDAFEPMMENVQSASRKKTEPPSSTSKASAPEEKQPHQTDQTAATTKNIRRRRRGGGGGPTLEQVQSAIGPVGAPVAFTYSEKDVILYALAIGASADPLNRTELQFTYEMSPDFQVLPTFGVIVPNGVLGHAMNVPGLRFDPAKVLHGEQYLELKRPIPSSGTLISHARIAGIYDKGKAALLVMDVTTMDEAGQEVLFNQYTLFVRGAGGFGGAKSPPSDQTRRAPAVPSERPPDVVHREQTSDHAALLYRLTGDQNPLHADPEVAKAAGFPRPILHGLCSFGYAVRAVLKHYANNNPKRFKSVKVRFVRPVYPGETLITEMWAVNHQQVVFRVKVAERGVYVLDGAVVELHPEESSTVRSKL